MDHLCSLHQHAASPYRLPTPIVGDCGAGRGRRRGRCAVRPHPCVRRTRAADVRRGADDADAAGAARRLPGDSGFTQYRCGYRAEPGSGIEQVAAWTDLPDLVTANQGEEEIVELCELLAARGVGIEAGLLSAEDARRFVAAGIAPQCVRVMVEPLDDDPGAAVGHAERIEQIVTSAGITLEQVHHGDGIASWAVNLRAIPRGHGIRTGLEDTPVLPDGRQARDKSDLVAAAAALLRR